MGIRSVDPRDISWNIHNYESIDRFFCSMIGAKSFIGNDSSWKVYNIYIPKSFYQHRSPLYIPNNSSFFDSFILVISLYIYVLVNSFIFLRFFLYFIWYNRIAKYLPKKFFFFDIDNLKICLIFWKNFFPYIYYHHLVLVSKIFAKNYCI